MDDDTPSWQWAGKIAGMGVGGECGYQSEQGYPSRCAYGGWHDPYFSDIGFLTNAGLCRILAGRWRLGCQDDGV